MFPACPIAARARLPQIHMPPISLTLLVPKLQLGNAVFEAPASPSDGQRTSRSLQDMGSQAGAWEPAKNGNRIFPNGGQAKSRLPTLA